MSFRWARSPEPPKMTTVDGSGVRARRKPSRSGLTIVVAATPSLLLDGVAAKLIAERGRDLHRVAVLLPRDEPREEGVGEDGRRDVVRDRLEDRPAALARVRDPAFDARELAALLLEGALGELEEP